MKRQETSKVRRKINWLLILQGWAMLWVVIGHAPLRMDEILGYHYAFALD